MTDLSNALSSLRRPRLLIHAARFGLQDYRRERDLRRLIEAQPDQTVETVVSRLMDAEARIEATRMSGDASYSIGRHIEMLIALMAEARLAGA